MTTNEAIVAMLVEFVARERAMRDAICKGGQQCNGSAPSINVSTLHELERMIRDAPAIAANYTTCFEDLARVTAERDQSATMAHVWETRYKVTFEAATHVAIERDALAKRWEALRGQIEKFASERFNPRSGTTYLAIMRDLEAQR